MVCLRVEVQAGRGASQGAMDYRHPAEGVFVTLAGFLRSSINTTQVGQNLETRMEPTSDAAAPSDNPPAVLLKASQAHRPGPIRNQGKKRKADRSTTASSDALTVVDKKAAQKTKKKRVSRKPKVQETDRPAMTFAHELGARGVALLEEFDQVDALYCVLVVSVQC